MRLLLATVRRGLLGWVCGPLSPPFRPIKDEVWTLSLLCLTLGKPLGLTFREYASLSQGFFENRQQPMKPLIDPRLTYLKDLS
jgi:hypothetical protein